MPTRTEKFYDLEVKNDHHVEDYKVNFAEGLNHEYNRLIRRISRIIQAEFGRKITVAKQREINREIQDEINIFLERIEELSEDELLQFQETFHESLSEIMREVDPDADVPEFQPVRGYMNKKKPIDHGKVISVNSMYTSTAAVLYQDMSSIVTRMSLLEEDPATLGNFYESAKQKSRNNIRNIGVTAVALVAGFTRDGFFRRSRDIIGHQHISVLDAATTDICQFRHGRVWYYDDSMSHLSTLPDSATPVLHINCRSEAIPIFRGEDPVEEESYTEWLERQDEATKKEVLGPRRYELYQSGEVSIRQFKDRQGNMLTLDELRDRIL